MIALCGALTCPANQARIGTTGFANKCLSEAQRQQRFADMLGTDEQIRVGVSLAQQGLPQVLHGPLVASNTPII
jgi:hypothetical protein